MKEAKRTQITEQICKQAQLMRKGGATQTEIGQLLGINPCRVSRMEASGFDYVKYQAAQRLRRAREKQKQPHIELTINSEELKAVMEPETIEAQMPGQLKMEFPAEEYGVAPPPKPVEDVIIIDQEKLMRFLDGRADKIVKAITEATAQSVLTRSDSIVNASTELLHRIETSTVMLNTKLDRLNDTLCMILRAVRRE